MRKILSYMDILLARCIQNQNVERVKEQEYEVKKNQKTRKSEKAED